MTTSEIYNNLIAQLEASLAQSVPIAPKSFLRVLARAVAAVFVILHKYANWMTLQQFVRYASFAETEVGGVVVSPLVEWGRLIGIGDPTPATRTEMIISITVENQTGTLPSGSQLRGVSNGIIYVTIGAVSLDSATVTAVVRATTAGTVGNLESGAEISFANPLANVGRVAEVLSVEVTGADAEDGEVYRQRVLDRFQKQPQGGALADYEQWGESVAGVLNVYPYPSDCPGQVDVYVESATEPDGIPTEAQLNAVLDAIEYDEDGLASRRPVGALVNTFPINRLGFDVVVTGLVSDDLAQVRLDIADAVEAYFLSREPYIAGLSVPPRRDRITRSGVAGVVDDIVSADGGIFSDVTIELDSALVELYSLDAGEKAKAATVTFSA
jgi:uncharacterized phage protein gp47/JayE